MSYLWLLNLKNNINVYNNEIRVKEQELKSKLKDIDGFESTIIDIKGDKSDFIYKLNDVVKNLSVISTKIATLRDNIDNNSTLPFSVKNVLENPKLRGIHNVIGSLIEVEEIYSKAISVVLGSNSNNVVIDNEICAKEAIKYLKDNNIGRVTFFPLNIIKEKFIDNETLSALKREQGYIDLASNLVKFDKTYENIIKNQLGNVIVVDNIDNANIISKVIKISFESPPVLIFSESPSYLIF